MPIPLTQQSQNGLTMLSRHCVETHQGNKLTHAQLSGIPQQLIDKLQKVQNCSAQLIFKTSKCTHISPLLARLHWLPIAQRIDTKFPPCAMMLSQILLNCTCLILAFTSLPVHCVPLLTPASFGFQHERKSSKGSMLSPISALSLGTNSPTLYVILKHNPSSKLN